MSVDLEDILETLKNEFGEDKISKKHNTPYKAIRREIRKETLAHLVKTLREAGKEKEYFKQNAVLNTIAMSYFPDSLTEYWEKKKRLAAYNTVWSELRSVVNLEWPEKTSKAENVVSTPKDWDSSKRMGKEIDPSIVSSLPKSSDLVDEEMSKLLGFDDE